VGNVEKAVIYNVMRYSIHDGPGIRTTVFFKGCPLSCLWCHNPESLCPEPQRVFNEKKCIKCGRCGITDSGAATESSDCPTAARETIGYEITIPELMREINKDRLFYEESAGGGGAGGGTGGVTFSGGEPMYQAEFLLEALARCREERINTAIDTSGYCDTAALLKAAEMANYVLYDIKCIDSEKHQRYCGAPNDSILKNLRLLGETTTKLLIRIPVIPGINDDMQEMTTIFEYIKGIANIEAVHLLPYHNIQTGKYEKIGKQYELSAVSGDESTNMDKIRSLFDTQFRTKVGG
jgi:pyruvate formate lyase activating enzyme